MWISTQKKFSEGRREARFEQISQGKWFSHSFWLRLSQKSQLRTQKCVRENARPLPEAFSVSFANPRHRTADYYIEPFVNNKQMVAAGVKSVSERQNTKKIHNHGRSFKAPFGTDLQMIREEKGESRQNTKRQSFLNGVEQAAGYKLPTNINHRERLPHVPLQA